jgi:hypothetical protein
VGHERLEITYRINTVEDEELRDRQLSAIVRLLRMADGLQRNDVAERRVTGNRADPPPDP